MDVWNAVASRDVSLEIPAFLTWHSLEVIALGISIRTQARRTPEDCEGCSYASRRGDFRLIRKRQDAKPSRPEPMSRREAGSGFAIDCALTE